MTAAEVIRGLEAVRDRRNLSIAEGQAITRGIELISSLEAELAQHRRASTSRWVTWKVGDALPADGMYWATIRYTTNEGNPNTVPRVEEIQSGWGEWQTYAEVLAYWPLKRPEPFAGEQKDE